MRIFFSSRSLTTSSAFDLAPEFAERRAQCEHEAPFAGATVTNFFRKPYGPGFGARRRCELQQGPDHGAGHHRCLSRPELCAMHWTKLSNGRAFFDDGMESTSVRATSTCCRCTNLPASWPPGATAAEMHRFVRRDPRQSERHGRRRPDERGDHLTAEFFSPKASARHGRSRVTTDGR